MLAAKNLDALVLEFISEFLKLPAFARCRVVGELIREVFTTLERHSSEHAGRPRVNFRNNVAGIGPHHYHCAIDFFPELGQLLLKLLRVI